MERPSYKNSTQRNEVRKLLYPYDRFCYASDKHQSANEFKQKLQLFSMYRFVKPMSFTLAIIIHNGSKTDIIIVTGQSDLFLKDNYTTQQLVLKSFHCHCEVNNTTQSTDLSTSQNKC